MRCSSVLLPFDALLLPARPDREEREQPASLSRPRAVRRHQQWSQQPAPEWRPKQRKESM